MKRNPVWQLSIATTAEAEDAVGTLLEEIFGITPTSYTDADTGVTSVSICSAKSFASVTHWRQRVRESLSRIRRCGLNLGSGRMVARRLRPENWAESWKRHFKPLAIGRKLLLKPSWSKRRPVRGQAVVILDPGLSFGTGQHPTTRFCLEQLVKFRRTDEEQSVLDVGTGSGILAIAAAKLGYEPVHAFDFDPESVRVARQNAKVNGVTKKLQLSQADVTRLSRTSKQKYTVVCANLLANLLLAQRAKLTARMTQTGALVVAGILQREFHEVQQAYERAGLKLVATQVKKEWQSGTFILAR